MFGMYLVANVHEKVHPLSFFIQIFIYKYHSSMTCGKIFFHVTKYSILGVTKYILNIPSMWEEYSKKDSVMLPYSCFIYSRSCSHAHEITSLQEQSIILGLFLIL
jgi:hypothetical protein